MLLADEAQVYELLKVADLTNYDNVNNLIAWAKNVLKRAYKNRGYVWELTDKLKSECQKQVMVVSNERAEELFDIYWLILKFESYWRFESYLLYMERNREYPKRFYEPRRKTLKVVVQDLQDLEDRVIEFYGLSMPSRVGKSTICIFFLSWIMLKRPNSHNAMGGHSGILADGFYGELLTLITSADYTFGELYAYHHPGKQLLQDKSAENKTITLDRPDRFATITCRGIDGTWTGAIDISPDGYLYVDDLVRDRQHSLSPTRMEDTFQEYLNKMCDRQNDGSRQLMVGTLWNVLDPLERLRVKYEDDPMYRFRRIPALNEDGESNFDYEYNGFSTKYYLKQKDNLDDPEWMAKFMQQPYVREGILLESGALRYFNGILPDGDSRVVAVCDVALGGGDYLSMPIGREYANGDIYVFDWIFNPGTKEKTLPEVVGAIIRNEIREERFEGNQGGDLYCEAVDKELSNLGYACSCTAKKAPNELEKKSKIMAYADVIKRKFVFLSPKRYTQDEIDEDIRNGVTRYRRTQEYDKAVQQMTTFVTIGKNAHDDAIDSITQLAMFVDNGAVLTNGYASVEPVINPFRGRY